MSCAALHCPGWSLCLDPRRRILYEMHRLPGARPDAETYTERLALMAIGPEDIGFEESDWAEVALRFTLSCDVDTAIIGTTNPDHVRANIEAAARGPLPEETIDKLREAFVEAVADAGEEWPGQT